MLNHVYAILIAETSKAAKYCKYLFAVVLEDFSYLCFFVVWLIPLPPTQTLLENQNY